MVWRRNMKVFVGYDTREDIAFQVCKLRIISNYKDVDVRPGNSKS